MGSNGFAGRKRGVMLSAVEVTKDYFFFSQNELIENIFLSALKEKDKFMEIWPTTPPKQ